MIRSTFSSVSRTVLASSSRRAFHTTPIVAKTVSETASDVNLKVGKTLASAIEKGEQAAAATKEAVGGSSVKEVADKVNKSAGRGLASTIEKGEQVTASTKETIGTASSKTQKTANVAGQKANQAAAGVREGKEDFKTDVKKEIRK
ncbi:hypothetical protein BC835DRAFT_1327380 [Cytidiella melzeri]|nr:hypothetical protein BC835DRAFT_1327380 [Cytidiella melzeri]